MNLVSDCIRGAGVMGRKEFMRSLFIQLYPPQKSLEYRIIETRAFFALRDKIMALATER